MRIIYIVVAALLLFCAVVLSQEQGAPQNNSEQPPYTNDPEQPTPPTDEPTLPNDPEQPAPKDSSSVEIMCNMLAIECPNNTWNIPSKNCELVCGLGPIGGLSWDQTNAVMQELETFYGSIISESYVSTIVAHGSEVKIQTPPESYSDYCIEVSLRPAQQYVLPDVFNGVRVFYTIPDIPVCSPIYCADGTVRDCGETCDMPERRGHFMFTPMTIILVVVILSACCCARRRRCRAKCNANKHATPAPVVNESNYPAENYQLLHESEAINMDYPAYPPMPAMPPMMMHHQHGMYPIMMQAPNGTWYPVVPQTPHEPADV